MNDFNIEQYSPSSATEKSGSFENILRPKHMSDYIGQEKLRNQLEIFIAAAKQRSEVLDHVLLLGPPGLGKTTLANIIAHEMQAQLKVTTGPALERTGDICALLTSLGPKDVLFIDEIHRIHPTIEETMYSALEDNRIDIMIGEGAGAKAIHLDLPPFTLVGATTRVGLLTTPLRDRFGIIGHLEYYNEIEIEKIVQRSAKLLQVPIDIQGAKEIAIRSRRTPRVANRLLKRTRDVAQIKNEGRINKQLAITALDLLDVDRAGLDNIDKKYLSVLINKFNGGPVGIDNLASAIGENTDTIESFVEPYLVKEAFISRTPRGRIANRLAYDHFQIPVAEKSDRQTDNDNQPNNSEQQLNFL